MKTVTNARICDIGKTNWVNLDETYEPNDVEKQTYKRDLLDDNDLPPLTKNDIKDSKKTTNPVSPGPNYLEKNAKLTTMMLNRLERNETKYISSGSIQSSYHSIYDPLDDSCSYSDKDVITQYTNKNDNNNNNIYTTQLQMKKELIDAATKNDTKTRKTSIKREIINAAKRRNNNNLAKVAKKTAQHGRSSRIARIGSGIRIGKKNPIGGKKKRKSSINIAKVAKKTAANGPSSRTGTKKRKNKKHKIIPEKVMKCNHCVFSTTVYGELKKHCRKHPRNVCCSRCEFKCGHNESM